MFDKKVNPVELIQQGALSQLEKALAKNPDLINGEYAWSRPDGSHRGSLLHVAASCDQAAIVRFLVQEKGMAVDWANFKQNTPLHHAGQNGAMQAAKELIALGADLNAKNSENNTPYDEAKPGLKDLLNPDLKLFTAVQTGDLDAFKAEVEKNPSRLYEDFRWQNNSFAGTLLHMAAFYNQPVLIDYLVTEKGMNVNNQKTAFNWTPLHHAAKNGAMEAAIRLLELGANPSLTNGKGNSPAAACDNPALKDLLQECEQEYAAEQTREKDIAKAAGAWTALSENEIMYARTLPGDSYKLTELFNFSSGVCTSITENLKSGQLLQSKTKFAKLEDQELLKQAKEQLAQAFQKKSKGAKTEGGDTPAAATPKNRYDKLKKSGM